jgi:hypothetical protein
LEVRERDSSLEELSMEPLQQLAREGIQPEVARRIDENGAARPEFGCEISQYRDRIAQVFEYVVHEYSIESRVV